MLELIFRTFKAKAGSYSPPYKKNDFLDKTFIWITGKINKSKFISFQKAHHFILFELIISENQYLFYSIIHAFAFLGDEHVTVV